MKGLSEKRTRQMSELAQRLGVNFKKLELLDEALTHKSFANEMGSKRNNERLEFLGDAALELAVSSYLYEKFPRLSEGELTRIRAGIVCSASLAQGAQRIGLGEALSLGHGEAQTGGASRQTNLEDAFEAVIGAVFLDQGFLTARSYVLRQLAEELEAVESGQGFRDYKTNFQELVQKEAGHIVEYELLDERGPDHEKVFISAVKVDNEVKGVGQGHTKKESEQAAAKKAMENKRLHA